jgi:RNA polymerase sigma-70 factor (ECF subfamily)
MPGFAGKMPGRRNAVITMSREDISQRERRRDFERRIDSCRRIAYAVAYQLLADAAEAEDVIQEGCVRAWQHYDAYDPQRPFEAWLLRIVRNLAIDAQRRRRRRRTISLEAPHWNGADGAWLAADSGLYGDPQAQALAVAERERIQQAVAELQLPHRQVLSLLYQREASYEAMAQALHCPVGTVRSRVFRARKAVRAALARAEAAV